VRRSGNRCDSVLHGTIGRKDRVKPDISAADHLIDKFVIAGLSRLAPRLFRSCALRIR
jgi:hypothetical protein